MSLIISSRVSNKSITSLTGDGSFTVPAGTVIDCIKLSPSASMAAVQIGTTPGGDEVFPAEPLTGGVDSLIGTLLNGGTVVYFTGVTASMQVTFFKK
jgi:hypothetical protein